jgi:hypothetical protein
MISKKQISKTINIGILGTSIIALTLIFLWPLGNNTNHTGYEPYNFSLTFIILGSISFVLSISAKNKLLNLTTIFISLVGTITLFSYKELLC